MPEEHNGEKREEHVLRLRDVAPANFVGQLRLPSDCDKCSCRQLAHALQDWNYGNSGDYILGRECGIVDCLFCTQVLAVISINHLSENIFTSVFL